jgi:hypothetical protein
MLVQILQRIKYKVLFYLKNNYINKDINTNRYTKSNNLIVFIKLTNNNNLII